MAKILLTGHENGEKEEIRNDFEGTLQIAIDWGGSGIQNTQAVMERISACRQFGWRRVEK